MKDKNSRKIVVDSRFISDFTPNEQLVMLQLAFHCNDNGNVVFSERGLAKSTGLTRQQIRTIRKNLATRQILTNPAINPSINPDKNPVSCCCSICCDSIYDNTNPPINPASNPTANPVDGKQPTVKRRSAKQPKTDDKTDTPKDGKYRYVVTGGMSEEERKFCENMPKKYPHVCKMERPLSFSELAKLKKKYDSKSIHAILNDMENWKPLLKKNVSAYQTVLKWMENGINRNVGTQEIEDDGCWNDDSERDELIDGFIENHTVMEQSQILETDYYWYSGMTPEGRRQYCTNARNIIKRHEEDAG